MSHQYSNENARLSDLWILIQAGNSTTVSAICFLLSDLAKNRDIQTKLASILSEFMPKKPNLTNDTLLIMMMIIKRIMNYYQKLQIVNI